MEPCRAARTHETPFAVLLDCVASSVLRALIHFIAFPRRAREGETERRLWLSVDCASLVGLLRFRSVRLWMWFANTLPTCVRSRVLASLVRVGRFGSCFGLVSWLSGLVWAWCFRRPPLFYVVRSCLPGSAAHCAHHLPTAALDVRLPSSLGRGRARRVFGRLSSHEREQPSVGCLACDTSSWSFDASKRLFAGGSSGLAGRIGCSTLVYWERGSVAPTESPALHVWMGGLDVVGGRDAASCFFIALYPSHASSPVSSSLRGVMSSCIVVFPFVHALSRRWIT